MQPEPEQRHLQRQQGLRRRRDVQRGRDGGTSGPNLSSVIFSGNYAGTGGAIYNDGGYNGTSSPTLSNVTFSGNRAGGGGATGRGGAMYSESSVNGTSSPSLSNVTFSGNSADHDGYGGAMYNLGRYDGTSSPALSNVTFSGNSAGTSGGAMHNFGGTSGTSGTSSPTLSNVIAWGNMATNGPEIYNDGSMAWSTIDHSVIQGSGGSGGGWLVSLGTDGGGNLDADPLLGPLQDNGGFTETLLLGAGSSAIDAGNDATCMAAPVNGLDQRGLTRPHGSHCDIGAVEMTVYALNVSVTGGGHVDAGASPAPFSGEITSCTAAGGASCAAVYTSHANVTLNASADVGQHFVLWSGDCSTSTASTSINMDADKTCNAAFATNTHNVGGTFSALAGSGLVLHLDYGAGSETISPGAAATGFAFTSAVPYGASYTVSIATQPNDPSQTCSVANGSGSMPDADVSAVVVSCTISTYTVGGAVSGLSGSGLILRMNGGNDLPVASNGGFTFPTGIASGGSYIVSVTAEPTSPKQTCSVSDASGTVVDSDINTVMVACVDATAVLDLNVDDGREFARYGLTLDYLVTLTNSGNAPANNVDVVGILSAGLDSANMHWRCIGAGDGATCTSNHVGPLADTVTLPENRSLTWIVTVPVKSDAPGDTVSMSVEATGATSVTDVNTLVIYRDGFNVAYADGTQGVTPAPGSAAVLRSDGSDSFRLSLASGDGIATVRTLRDAGTTIKVQRLTLGQTTWVRLLQQQKDGVERTSAWTGVAADARLIIGSVAGSNGQRIILLEGASQALSLPLAD